MKRILSILLSIAVMATMFAVPVSASNQPTVTVASVEEATAIGEDVKVTVSVANNPSFTNFDWAINYDTERLSLTAFETTFKYEIPGVGSMDIAYLNPLLVESNVNAGKISAAGSSAYATEAGTLFNLVFTVKENAPSGKAAVSVVSDTIEKDGVPVVFNYVAGTVNVDGIDCNDGHDWSDWQTRTEPTCEEEGLKFRTCKRAYCGIEDTEAIPELGHSYGEWTEVDELNHKKVCATDSSHVVTETHKVVDGVCADCGYEEATGDTTTGGSTTDDDEIGGSTTGGSTTGGTTTGDDETGGSTTGGNTTGGNTTGGGTTGGTTTDGELPSIDEVTGWEDIKAEISNSQQDTITVDMNGAEEVPAEIFETIAGTNTTVEFKMDNGTSWTIDSGDIPEEVNFSKINLNVQLNVETIPAEVVNEIEAVETVQVELAHNGEFGFTMYLNVGLDSDYAGLWANLYYFNEATNSLEFKEAIEIDANGNAKFGFNHASNYVIAIDTESHSTGGSTTGGSTTGGSTTGGSTTGGSTTGGSTTGGSTTGGSTTGGSTTGDSTTGGSTTGGSTTGGSTTGGSTTGGSTTGGSTTGGSTTGGSTTGGSTTGGSTTGGSTTGGSTTGGSTTGGSTTGGTTTGGSTTGGSTTGGSTTGGSTSGGSTTGGSTTGGSTTGGSTTGGSTTGGTTTGGSTTGGSTTGGSTTGGSTTGGSTTGGSTTGGSTTGGSTTGGSTTGGSTTGGSTTGGSTTGGSTTGGSTTGGSTTGGSTTGGSTTGGSTTGGSTTGGSTTGGTTTGGSTTGGSTTGGSTTGGTTTGGCETGHSYGNWTKVDDDNHKKECACGDVVTEAHTWDAGVVTTPATYKTTGIKTYTCSVCSGTKTEVIPKLIHYSNNSGGGGSVEATKYTVRFDSNGGSSVASKTVKENAVLAKPADPIKEGYKFVGWYTDAELTTSYDFTAKVTNGFTLYAKWEEVKEDDKDTDKPATTMIFNDVKEADWYYEAVKFVNEMGLMNGVAEEEFAPELLVTRAMLATILYRNEGEPAVNRSIPFADIDMSAYYANAVIWAHQNGIVKGITETEFAPDQIITREQIVAMIFRYAQYKGMATTTLEENLAFADSHEISEYAVSALNWAVGIGLIKGRTENTVHPRDNATRAELATILYRFFGSKN